jgi:hypothetical protein
LVFFFSVAMRASGESIWTPEGSPLFFPVLSPASDL